jgi:D-proline reductase (dithiol) PrdB
VGLIQRQVEEAGIPTISMGNAADRMANIKPPRAMLVKFARGSMFGEPGNVKRQRRIILDALEALQTMTDPGTIQELPYRWKQPDPR